MPELHFGYRDHFHPLAILELWRAFRRNERIAPHRLEEYQMDRLRRVLDVAAREIPYYRALLAERGLSARDFRTVADLSKLPTLRKADVRKEGNRLRRPGARARITTTSGTTSEPLHIAQGATSRALEFAYYLTHWGWAGYRLGDRFAQLVAQEFHDHRGAPLVRVERLTGRLLLDSSALSAASLPTLVDAIRRHGARFLKGLASPLYFLALLCEEHGIRDLSFRAVFSTGEMLVPARRRTIERVFGCRVLDSYGMLEQAAAVSECPSGSLHVRGDYALMELLPIADRPAAPGLRSVVGTTLHDLAMPLVRYETGDHVELAEPGAACACGRTLPIVRALHGRTEDAVVTPDGRYVTTLFLAREHVESARIAQFVQEDERTLIIRVVPGRGFGDADSRALVEETRRLVGEAMRVELALVDESAILKGPTGKVPLVICRRGPGQAPTTFPQPATRLGSRGS